MANYTITLTEEEEAGLDFILADSDFGTKQEIVEKMIKMRCAGRLKDEHAKLQKEKTLEQIKQDLDNA